MKTRIWTHRLRWFTRNNDKPRPFCAEVCFRRPVAPKHRRAASLACLCQRLQLRRTRMRIVLQEILKLPQELVLPFRSVLGVALNDILDGSFKRLDFLGHAGRFFHACRLWDEKKRPHLNRFALLRICGANIAAECHRPLLPFFQGNPLRLPAVRQSPAVSGEDCDEQFARLICRDVSHDHPFRADLPGVAQRFDFFIARLQNGDHTVGLRLIGPVLGAESCWKQNQYCRDDALPDLGCNHANRLAHCNFIINRPGFFLNRASSGQHRRPIQENPSSHCRKAASTSPQLRRAQRLPETT